MEQANITIRLLETKIASVLHKLRAKDTTDDDLEQGELLIEVIEHYVRDLQRRYIEKRAATLEDLAQLKVGIRIADVLLDRIRETGAEAMEGWQYGWNANPTQSRYSFLYDLAMRLGWSIAEIESHYPQHASWFDAERADYRQSCEQGRVTVQ